MNVSLYQAAAAMNANARWQEVVSENLSSSAYPGFKKQELSFSAIEAGKLAANPATGLGGLRSWSIPSTTSTTNFTTGEVLPTGNPLDFGLEGTGFFEVQMPDGTSAYTRDGEFKLDTKGHLVTKQGFLVLGDSGPLQFDSTNAAPITISPTGEVAQGTDAKGRLKLVDFPEPGMLNPAGSGFFLAQPGALPLPAATTSVCQGSLESSNTSSLNEMANLISSLRMFEANQRVIQSQDERMGRVIADLGNPN